MVNGPDQAELAVLRRWLHSFDHSDRAAWPLLVEEMRKTVGGLRPERDSFIPPPPPPGRESEGGTMTPEVERLLADLRHCHIHAVQHAGLDVRAVVHAGLEAADLIERLAANAKCGECGAIVTQARSGEWATD